MINRVSRLRNTVRRPTAFRWRSRPCPACSATWKALASWPRAYCTPATANTAPRPSPGSGARLRRRRPGERCPRDRPTAGGTVPAPHHDNSHRLPPPRPACGPAASGPRARRDHLAWRLRPVKSVWRDGKIAGLIAWAPARPALFDVACVLEHAAPFRDDEECARWLRYPRPPSRRCRIEVFHGACSIADPGERQCPRRPAAAHAPL